MVVLLGCKKLIEIDSPQGEIVGKDIYNTNANAISVITGVYGDMGYSSIFQGKNSISVCAGLSADEFTCISNSTDILSLFYRNGLLTDDGGFWANLYTYIYRLNSAIEGISASTGITTSVKNQLLGEAKFTRAFMYYYLLNLYGDVPLLTTTDVIANSNSTRTAATVVYTQIIKDLKEATLELKSNYVGKDVLSNSTERIRPNSYAATALLSRVYLTIGDWTAAEREASTVISNSGMYILEELNSTFLNTSKEAIWQIQPTVNDLNTLDATLFNLKAGTLGIPVSGPNSDNRPVYLSDGLYSSFEIGDERMHKWLDTSMVYNRNSGELVGIYPFANKYKVWLPGQPRTEYLMVLRLAEQYLIRSEARARQGKISGVNSAESDLNMIRNRAGLADIHPASEAPMLFAILQERRHEFFTEWGHRWFDLKRTGEVNNVMAGASPLKGGIWASYKSLFPIPVVEFKRNPSLRSKQNPGYPEM